MNIKEETQKAKGGAIRYGVLFLGLIILLFSQSIITWKQAAASDARGAVKAIEFEITELKREAEDADSKDKKEIRAEIKILNEEDLLDARIDREHESVDAERHIWITNMIHFLGLALSSLGLIIIAVIGSSHEKVGALVALGFIISRL